MLFFDTETCGFHGPIVLIQWAEDDGKISLHNTWHTPVRETMQLIEFIVSQTVVGFNIAFDWFHICQMYTTMQLLDPNKEPQIFEYALAEKEGRNGPCLKPAGVLDLMLHARKGPYQSTMGRDDIRIKKVPMQLAYALAEELTKRIPIKDIYFAKGSDPKRRWQVTDVKDDFGDIVPDFKDVVLRFNPSSALKALAVDALKVDGVLLLDDVGVPKRYNPVEYGFAPYALSGYFLKGKHYPIDITPGPKLTDWGYKWPDMINKHITHWGYNDYAIKYATDDVVYTRGLYHYFNKPAPNDDDSVLAAMVGAIRWRGLAIDSEKITGIKAEAIKIIDKTRKVFNFQAPDVCKKYLSQVMTPDEQTCLKSTKRIILEELATWHKADVCSCNGMDQTCKVCSGTGLKKLDEMHPVAERAQQILDARRAKKKIEVFDKILVAGRFHASFDVIGALSSRMSGADGLNPQGINRETAVRECFTLAWDGMETDGGDFDGFEVSIVDAVYKDPVIHEELLSGKKFHGMLGTHFFPDMTYDQIMATKNLPGEADKYIKSKNGTFAIIYMGEGYTLHNRVGISELVAEEAFQSIIGKYKVFARERRKYMDMFCSMKQVGGIGTQVTWAEPHDYIETMIGFKRYFTLENQVCRALFQLAEEPPKEWTAMKLKVKRRERIQTACGSVRTALFAASFALQSANMRAAGNHVIQGTGSQLTKKLQTELWDIQPCGIHDWLIMLLNIHDEVLSVINPIVRERERTIVETFVEEHKSLIPLLKIDWKENMVSWGQKG